MSIRIRVVITCGINFVENQIYFIIEFAAYLPLKAFFVVPNFLIMSCTLSGFLQIDHSWLFGCSLIIDVRYKLHFNTMKFESQT